MSRFKSVAQRKQFFTVFAIVAGVIGTPLLLLHMLSSIFSSDDLTSQLTSPDGAYVANVRNFDSLAFGYDYITLEPAHFGLLGLRRQRVIEFVFEGSLSEVQWRDSRTLVVRYRHDPTFGPKLTDDFVTNPARWGDVQFVYEVLPPKPTGDPKRRKMVSKT